MTSLRSKSGSALIIVLGFLSFMVVSAVAFSVYMRTERVSSSGFHRSASVRQMVKAGMANAIAQVDAAIGSDPFPGLQAATGKEDDLGIDHWRNCVFMPYRRASSDVTVPVIPLEGLAYLPPAIVNEVRGAARNTYSAQWQNLDYDIGRFAYVAVNVSDFFDINKIRFGTQRNSSQGGRVSLAYLFQNEQGTALDVSGTQLKNLDDFIKTRGGGESKVPFVSMADFNVALYKRDPIGSSLGIYSPFYSYLKAGKARAFYSQSGDENNDLVDRASRMLFVTGSWQLPTNNPVAVIDLAKDSCQPFPQDAFSDNKSLETLENSTGRAYKERLNQEISRTSLANLYDYLDDNSVPLSLAIPNVERVPMIGVVDGTMLAKTVQFTLKGETDEGAPFSVGGGGAGSGATYTLKTTTFKLEAKSTVPPQVNLVCMYPFKGKAKREGEKSTKSYKAQVVVKIFFTKPGTNGGTTWSGRCFQPTQITPVKAVWDKENYAGVDNECITLVSRKTPITSFPEEVFEDKESVFDVMVSLPRLNSDQINTDLAKKTFLEIQRLWERSEGLATLKEFTGKVNGKDFPNASTFKILPFSGDLPFPDGAQVVNAYAAADAEKEVMLDGAKCWQIATLTPHIAMWARIIDDKGKTVDLAPAAMYDDELNGGALARAKAMAFCRMYGDGSVYTPMLVAQGKPIVFSKETYSVALEGGAETLAPFDGVAAAFAALDPRFNNSPEDFIANPDGFTRDGYLQEIKKLLGEKGRDPDVFMFASDQEYLQSIGELAFLPKIAELGDTQEGIYAKCSTPQPFRRSFDELQQDQNRARNHSDSFWRTYPLYKLPNDGYQPDDYLFKYFSSEIEAGDKIIVNDMAGFKVNPYSEIEKIRLAVTANTPHSFWASSTNTTLVNNKPPCFDGPNQPKAIDKSLTYCFNQLPNNVGPELAWRDVTNMTAYVFGKMRSDALNARKDWEDSLAEMDWYPDGDPERIFEFPLDDASDDLHGVDRKMLYSFWHDSMANRQQLFLVFVRVEAIPLGASDNAMADIMPPQHGGRAVALVWRDPVASSSARRINWRNQEGGSTLFNCSLGEGSSYVPHRTRLLFYHQFD